MGKWTTALPVFKLRSWIATDMVPCQFPSVWISRLILITFQSATRFVCLPYANEPGLTQYKYTRSDAIACCSSASHLQFAPCSLSISDSNLQQNSAADSPVPLNVTFIGFLEDVVLLYTSSPIVQMI